jgi:ABC-2 type transport system permease protein
MRKVFAIQFLHTKEFFKSPPVILLMFIMPILFSFIFGGLAIGSETKKPVVNIVHEKDEITAHIVKLLKKNDEFQWVVTTESEAKKNVKDQKAIAAVVISKDISSKIASNMPLFDVIVQRKTDQYLALAPFLEGTVRLIYNSYQTLEKSDQSSVSRLLKAVSDNKGVQVNKQVIQKEGENQNAVNIMFIGFALMFMMFGLSGASSTILDEKKGGTWERLLISPVTKWQIISGYLGAYFLMGWLQFSVLMIAMKLLFDTHWGNLAYFIPFGSLVIFCVIGFGLMIAGLVKTKQQAIALSAVLITSTCMLGGVYWSLDLVPEFMKKISMFVPQSWAMSGFEEIVSGSLHTQTLLLDAVVLLGFSILFYAIGLRLIKH